MKAESCSSTSFINTTLQLVRHLASEGGGAAEERTHRARPGAGVVDEEVAEAAAEGDAGTHGGDVTAVRVGREHGLEGEGEVRRNLD